MRTLNILGTRGIPGKHGGFETFAEKLASYLAERDWVVRVYCQAEGVSKIWEDEWKNITRVHVGSKTQGALGTLFFDAKCVRHARKKSGMILTLGYNTAVFSLGYIGSGKPHVMNMDGIEWKRKKWSLVERGWLYANERVAGIIVRTLVADHPEIASHLSRHVSASRIVMIPYGSDAIYNDETLELPPDLGLVKDEFALLVARPEPENSVLEVVRAFCRKRRRIQLVILGKYEPERNEYHEAVMKAANEGVRFLGAIYDPKIVSALRRYCRLYIHGHTVGGTNPSLVEALGAGNAVLAHDNKFNRWVAGGGALYFEDEASCERALEKIVESNAVRVGLQEASRRRHKDGFEWDVVLSKYEELLETVLAAR